MPCAPNMATTEPQAHTPRTGWRFAAIASTTALLLACETLERDFDNDGGRSTTDKSDDDGSNDAAPTEPRPVTSEPDSGASQEDDTDRDAAENGDSDAGARDHDENDGVPEDGGAIDVSDDDDASVAGGVEGADDDGPLDSGFHDDGAKDPTPDAGPGVEDVDAAVCSDSDPECSMTCSECSIDAGTSPFDCIAPDPPATSYPEVLTPMGPPPNMVGGSVPDGRYSPTRIDLYGSATSIDVRAFEFRGGFVQVSSRSYAYPMGTSSSPELQFAGSYATTNDLMQFDVQRCDPQDLVDVPDVWYTPSANGLTTVVLLPNGTPMVTLYERE